jgi:hypothetical protein
MILDKASSHVVSCAKVSKSHGLSTFKLSNMTLVFLPPKVQLLNQGIIAFFKIRYKKKLLELILSQYATLKDLRKVVMNIRHAIMWSYEVWSELDA